MLSLCNNKSHKCVIIFIAILVNGPACHVNGSKKICMCNAKIGYCGNDYKSCVKWNESDIGEGYQLTANCKFSRNWNIFKVSAVSI